ncbi:MAG: lipoyl synthase [Candidatus Altiarchaeales archaeon]|nr:lipoyl synthase [Candidatus Altiarchaeales archaeon]
MKPPWLKSRPIQGPSLSTHKILRDVGLNTVCIQAHCPNKDECWGCQTATFLILGSKCTRSCRFCSVETASAGEVVDEKEPEKIVEASGRLDLSYVVLTSPDRDDLGDLGAGHYVSCIRRLVESGFRVEALTPDFAGDERLVEQVADSGLSCFAHNIETVKSISPKIRDARASYEQSLKVLSHAKKTNPKLVTKSSLLLGLGETLGEVEEAMRDLVDLDVDVLVLGQYLRPTTNQVKPRRYYSPREFEELRMIGFELGFKHVVSKPLARTSYRAREVYELVAGEFKGVRQL